MSTVIALLFVLLVQYNYVKNSTIFRSTERITLPSYVQQSSLASIRTSSQSYEQSKEEHTVESGYLRTHNATTSTTSKNKDDLETKVSALNSSKMSNIVLNVATKPVTEIEYDQNFDTELSKRIHTLTNKFRIEHNLPALQTDSTLSNNARSYSILMLKNGFLSHTNTHGCDMSCRFKNDGYAARAWGENLAILSFDDQVTVEYVAQFFMNAWEKSDEHRENLLSSEYTLEGVGSARDAHTLYVTVQFAKPM